MERIFVTMIFLLFASTSNAQSVSCAPMESVAQQFRGYLPDYLKFEAAYDTLSDRDRWDGMKAALEKNIKMLQKISEVSRIPLAPYGELNLILDYSFGLQGANDAAMTLPVVNTNTMRSLQHMRNGLLGFRLAMQHKLEEAQINYPNCEISERK